MTRPLVHRALTGALSLTLSSTIAFGSVLPSVAMAAPAKRGTKKAADAPAATDGRTVALLRFSGAPRADELRGDIDTLLRDRGFTVKGVALNLEAAASKVKCKGEPRSAQCLDAVGRWLNSNPKTAADFIVFGQISDAAPARAEVVAFDIAKNTPVETFDSIIAENDLIAPIVLPQALVTALQQHIEAPAAATEEEQRILAELDEPEQTPEERAALQKAIEDAEKQAAAAQRDAVIDTENIEVDLKKDFKEFCRTGPRKKRESREDPKDVRPKCSMGPFWGYWQPRAWVALGLTAGAAIGTGVMYGLALAARGPYKDAVSDLDAYNDSVPGDPRRDPNSICNNGQCYDELATEVSRTGATMRRRAIVGDILLGTTVLVGGVLAIMIFQDRSAAKSYIKQEKGLRAISDVRVGPILTKETKGAGMGFRF